MRGTFCLLFTFLFCQLTLAQQKEIRPFSIELDVFQGSIVEHNPDIAHLIVGHPTGFIISYNRKTYGWNEWESRYNFPDWGFSFAYQDMKNPILGKNYSIYGHYNWYFWNRNLSVGVAQGIAYNTNPYDSETNFENNAYGSRFLSSTLLRARYVKENVYKGIGINAGFGFLHYSNANLKAPNNSTNTLYFNVGLSYQPDAISFPTRIGHVRSWRGKSSNYAERIKYNLVLRTGTNEADVNGLGQFPFYTISVFADKRLNYKTTIQAGIDVFFSHFLIDLIRFRAVAFPEDGLTGNEDYRRVGAFVGHELRFNRTAFVSQLGYYVYWPYEFENQIYNRLGLKRYFLNEKMFAVVAIHAHWAKAEAVEFGVGVRL